VSVLLLQLDGKVPNIALMRIAAHHEAKGIAAMVRTISSPLGIEKGLFDADYEAVYASTIFTHTRPIAERLRDVYPKAVIGGTGWDVGKTLESIGITTNEQDYSGWPKYQHSIGFTQRGCRLSCKFCVVPEKEGKVKTASTVHEIWRGDPWPRNIVLLDNDFFGSPDWPKRIEEIRNGGFRVSFNQGINARMLNDETAAAIASIPYYDDDFKAKRIYTAWDNRKDERRLFAGLEALTKYGVKPDEIMVYMLIGYWPGETEADREYRRKALRDFGCRPYPMPYVRTPELVGFQRWVIRRCDMVTTWEEYKRANFRPENIESVRTPPTFPMFDGIAS
jgi:hypothetical protein